MLYIEVASYCCTVLHVCANRCMFFLFLSFFYHCAIYWTGCRKGFEASVLAANADQWRDAVLSHMTMFHGIPMLEELVRLPGVMDVMGRIAELKAELSYLRSEAERKPRALNCGRQHAKTDKKKVSGLKRALSQMSSSGDSFAEAALEKVKEDTRQPEESNSKKTRRRQKLKRRGVRAKRPYKRVQGDEIRLIKKREIVASVALVTLGYTVLWMVVIAHSAATGPYAILL